MDIDWNRAPEGATHWDTGGACRAPGWMRLDGRKQATSLAVVRSVIPEV